MLESIYRVKDVVRECLESDVKCRNSDKWLTVKVLQKMGYNIYIDYTQLAQMPSFESIRRTRQKFQENGEFMPMDEIFIERRRQEYQMRMAMVQEWKE